MVTIYTNGNFFADKEVPAESRVHMYQEIAKTKAEYVLVESLPQFITEEKIQEAKKYLREDQKLVVAIGLQSADDTVRALSVNTTCTRQGFERAYEALKKHDYMVQAFLMVKPPFLTEAEAVEDTVKSIAYLNELGIDNPILCATRVAPNTVLSDLYQDGEFRPPWLWSVIEVLKRSAVESPGCHPRVVVGELKQSSNPDSVTPHNCELCNERVVNAINSYNTTLDINALSQETCSCHAEYDRQKLEEQQSKGTEPLVNRVKRFLVGHIKTSQEGDAGQVMNMPGTNS
jgi:radical SAM enzyme (TIGR01210 family)